MLSILPKVEVNILIRGLWEGCSTHQEKRIDVTAARVGQENWLQVHADQEYVVKIELNQIFIGKKVSKGGFRKVAVLIPKRIESCIYFLYLLAVISSLNFHVSFILEI